MIWRFTNLDITYMKMNLSLEDRFFKIELGADYKKTFRTLRGYRKYLIHSLYLANEQQNYDEIFYKIV